MKLRKIKTISYAHEYQMGPMRVKQPLPSRQLEAVSPFLLLHHAGPKVHEAGQKKPRLSPHPHRGFEPVTFLFSGKIHHRDSLGNEGFLQSGDVQWMTAGSGVVHSEGPSQEFADEGGTLELIQLWINLPAAHKMSSARYQDISSTRMPQLFSADKKWQMKLVAGAYEGMQGPAETFTPILAMMVHFEAGSSQVFKLPAQYQAMLYLLDGKLAVDGQELDGRNLLVFEQDGEAISLEAKQSGKLLLLAGEPIDEPVVSYGPFVMNTEEEIMEAMADYEAGKMGKLDF